jgi:hypothetical protein
METTAQFIAKFNNVNFTATDLDKVIGDYRGNRFELSISTKISNTIIGNMAVQVVIRVSINGAYAQSWGSTSNEENMELVKWFKKIENDAQVYEWGQRSYEEKQAKNLFDSL